MDKEPTPEERRRALLEDLIAELDEVHAGVLFWMMRRAGDEQVADELFKAGIIKEKWGASSIVARRTELYRDLGYPTDMHKDIKRPLFEFECYPIIKLLTDNDPDKIREFPLRKKVIETAPPVPEKPIEQPVEQEPEPEPSPVPSPFLRGILLGILIGVLPTVAYFTFFRNLSQVPAPTETAAPSLTSLPTSNVLPTETLQLLHQQIQKPLRILHLLPRLLNPLPHPNPTQPCSLRTISMASLRQCGNLQFLAMSLLLQGLKGG